MKYRVGDKVRIRKDLKSGSEYGDRYVTTFMGDFSNKVVTIKYVGEDYYEVEEGDYCEWTDEMIEGLWKECKPKLKLIDILNKIANGELKEGTKVKHLNNIYIYKKYEGKEYASLYRETADSPETDFFYDERHRFMSVILREEVELIEPDHFGKADKMAEPTDNTKIEELDINLITEGITCNHFQILATNKLNEIIRKINKEG